MRTDNVVLDLEFSVVLADNDPIKVDAHLRYDAGDPFAVSVSFDAGGQPDRVDVCSRPARQGSLGSCRRWRREGLAPRRCSLPCALLPSGKAVLETRRPAIADFMARIERIVPVGRESEFVDVDRELESLFS